MLHKNSQKRFYDKGHIYFITTVTEQRFPYFKEDLFCELFMENLRLCKKIKEFELYAFIIIPDHVHLLIRPSEEFNISKIMQSLKQNVSCDINRVIEYYEIKNNINQNEGENNNNEGETPASRLHCCYFDKINNIFKNKGIDYANYGRKFIQKYDHPQHDMPDFKWQQSFHDHVIRNEKDFNHHCDYTIFNCIKHGICEDEEKYRWSSMNEEFGDLIYDKN